MARLTDAELRTARWSGRDYWLSDGGGWGDGRLLARVTKAGVAWCYRYRIDGRWRYLRIGKYPEIGLRAARDRVIEFEKMRRDGIADLHAHFERLEVERQRQDRQAIEQATQERERTLRRMCELYVDRLRREQKESAPDVESVFRLYVYPSALADWPAASIEPKDVARLVRGVAERGKLRTASVLRSYLRAAFELALRAAVDPRAPAELVDFGLKFNPVAAVPVPSGVRARDRVLSRAELSAYLRRVEGLPAGTVRDALLVQLLTGGQRPAQLVRATVEDVDLDGGMLILRDPKGARTQPRVHAVPLVGEARDVAARLAVQAARLGCPWLFSTDGKTHVRQETLGAAAQGVARAMVKAGEVAATFQLRDIRRSVETLLASAGVSREVRAQLQSHGLSGVQARHYDRHDYAREKTEALRRLHAMLTDAEPAATVIPLRSAG